MHILAGTSGFAYKEWKGRFYPADVKPEGMLRFYGEQFPAVEINNTFYRMPTEKVLLQWAAQVPEDFRFALKASQRITHRKRLKDAGEELAYFLRTANVLGARLGPTLFQLPPNLKLDLARLTDFLGQLPRGWRAAFEFRHASWLVDQVYAALREHGAALVIADTDPEQSDLRVPFEPTTDWGYLRLRGSAYDDAALGAWAERVRAAPWREAYVFFKHEDAGAGPALAHRFLELCR